MKLYIHAPNVHQGGGRILLEQLLMFAPINTSCILDERMPKVHAPDDAEIYPVKPTIVSRFKAEILLFKNAKADDTVLCFGNLPPLFKSKASVKIFLQNRYMFGRHDFSKFSAGIRIRLFIERWWFRARMKSDYQVIVQSQTMQRELKEWVGLEAIVLPFIEKRKEVNAVKGNDYTNKEFDFVYVSSAEPHKNHSALLKAWVILAQQGVKPSLALTVNSITAFNVSRLIDHTKNSYDLNIVNFGTLEHGQVRQLYQKSKALIFPSKLESFGLPLIEAKMLSLPILAPELDYVRDVVQPDQTFDSESPVSIARAVMRHLGIHYETVTLLEADSFLYLIQAVGRV